MLPSGLARAVRALRLLLREVRRDERAGGVRRRGGAKLERVDEVELEGVELPLARRAAEERREMRADLREARVHLFIESTLSLLIRLTTDRLIITKRLKK